MGLNQDLSSPVVFVFFNRPDETEKVFSAIRAAKPKTLYLISDGPRLEIPGERELVDSCRNIVEQVDWACEVFRNYSDTNLGCRRRVISGLDWVFSEVESAIILEDDCLPSPDFFRFTEELLIRFKGNEQIGAICGTNPLEKLSGASGSYFFSTRPSIWGWATWARVWKHYDGNLRDWPAQRSSKLLETSLFTKRAIFYWRDSLDLTYKKQIDTWDYQLTYQFFKTGQLCAVPRKNLVSNIGFGPGATHTLDSSSQLANIQPSPMEFPLAHPEEIRVHPMFDQELENRFTPARWRLWVSKVARILPKRLALRLRGVYSRLQGSSKSIPR
jgi:hypothetical protein